MLTTLTQPTSGSIIIDGYDAKKFKNEVRASFGIVFQDQSLDEELTAYENMLFHSVIYGVPEKTARERIKSLLKMVELDDKCDELVKNYSGGMKRRLEIARGLTHHPKILFLDEPTTGLDPQTRNRVWEHIRKLNKSENMTIFFTTHYMGEAEDAADAISIIDHGKIISHGTVESVKKFTGSENLEDAFIKLTGRSIRAEGGSALDRMRRMRGMRR
jgi:ABC-2 type transport system ATP-binding protein